MTAAFIALLLTWLHNNEPLLTVLLSSEPPSNIVKQLQSSRVISTVTLLDAARKAHKKTTAEMWPVLHYCRVKLPNNEP